MDLFDEISKTKQEIPKVKTIKNEVVKYKLNFYQIFAIGLFIVFFFCTFKVKSCISVLFDESLAS